MIDQGLLEGAHRAIERWGWRQATLERIATEAGVSRMTLHRRGVTRDGLLGALSERLEDAYRSSMWPALTASGSGRERLEQALAGYCDAVEANLELVTALAEADHNAIFHEDGPRGLTRRAFTEPIRRLLQDGAADGSLADEDPEETATLLMNLVSWTYRHLRRGHGWEPERARDGVLRIALDGVAAPVSAGLDRRGLAVLAAGHACADMAQGAVPALLPFLIDQRGISYGAAGALVLVTSVGSSAIQPLFGLGSDRLSLPWLMPLGVLLAGLGVALVGLTSSYAATAVAVAVSGIGVAAFHPEGARFANQVSGDRRGQGMSFFSLGGNAGFALGPILVTPLVLIFGLHGTLLLAVIPTIVAVVLARDLRPAAGRRRREVRPLRAHRRRATIATRMTGTRSCAWAASSRCARASTSAFRPSSRCGSSTSSAPARGRATRR